MRGIETGCSPEPISVLLGLQLPLALPGQRVILATLGVSQLPRSVPVSPATPTLVVLSESPLRILAEANIEAPSTGTPKDINVVGLAGNA